MEPRRRPCRRMLRAIALVTSSAVSCLLCVSASASSVSPSIATSVRPYKGAPSPFDYTWPWHPSGGCVIHVTKHWPVREKLRLLVATVLYAYGDQLVYAPYAAVGGTTSKTQQVDHKQLLPPNPLDAWTPHLDDLVQLHGEKRAGAGAAGDHVGQHDALLEQQGRWPLVDARNWAEQLGLVFPFGGLNQDFEYDDGLHEYWKQLEFRLEHGEKPLCASSPPAAPSACSGISCSDRHEDQDDETASDPSLSPILSPRPDPSFVSCTADEVGREDQTVVPPASSWAMFYSPKRPFAKIRGGGSRSSMPSRTSTHLKLTAPGAPAMRDVLPPDAANYARQVFLTHRHHLNRPADEVFTFNLRGSERYCLSDDQPRLQAQSATATQFASTSRTSTWRRLDADNCSCGAYVLDFSISSVASPDPGANATASSLLLRHVGAEAVPASQFALFADPRQSTTRNNEPVLNLAGLETRDFGDVPVLLPLPEALVDSMRERGGFNHSARSMHSQGHSQHSYTPQLSAWITHMPIKLSRRRAARLNALGRRMADGSPFRPDRVFLPQPLLFDATSTSSSEQKEISDVAQIIARAAALEAALNYDRFLDQSLYLTLRVGETPARSKHDTWHVDLVENFGPQFAARSGSEAEDPLRSEMDRVYVIADRLGTEFTDLRLDFSELRTALQTVSKSWRIDDLSLHEDFIDPAVHLAEAKIRSETNDAKTLIQRLPENQLAFLNAYAIHRAAANEKDHPVMRSFLRLTFSVQGRDRLGSTLNPVFGPVEPAWYVESMPMTIPREVVRPTARYKEKAEEAVLLGEQDENEYEGAGAAAVDLDNVGTARTARAGEDKERKRIKPKMPDATIFDVVEEGSARG